MAYVPNSGSVVAFQSDPTKLVGTVSVVGLPTTQNVSGSVVATQGTNPWIITGSVQTSLTPAANQSVSGTVGSSIIGTVPVTQATTEWTVKSSLAGGIFPISGSVAATVTNFPTNQNVSGSVVAFQGGTRVTSLVSTVPSSVIVGASIFGTAPVTQSGTWKVSVAGVQEDTGFTDGAEGTFALGVRNDTVASFVSANSDYTPFALDSAGRQLIKPFASEDATIISYVGSVVSASVTLIQASAVGLRNYITDFWVTNTGSVTQLITFQGGDTSIVGFTIAPAGGGSNAPGIAIPLKSTRSQDLAFKATGTSSIVYLTVKGYQAP